MKSFVELGRALLFLILCGTETLSMGQDSFGMKLELKAEKAKCLIGEPVSFRYVLRNLAGHPFPMDDAFALGQRLQLQYRHETDTEFRAWAPANVPDIWGYAKTTLPVEGVSVQRLTAFDANKIYTHPDLLKQNRTVFALMDLPGAYYFKAVYESESPKNKFQIESEVVKMDATKPEGIDFEASKLWMNNELLYAVDEPSGMPSGVQAGYQKLKVLVAAYPDSKYAQFARAAISRIEAATGGKSDSPAVGDPQKSPANAVQQAAPAKASSLSKTNSGPAFPAAAGRQFWPWVFGSVLGAALIVFFVVRRR
jgi:hypothetical protein